MSNVTAAMVKELRERTGAGMMECKKALVEVSGNIEEAVTVLRKRGQAKAAKRAGKIAAEGVIVSAIADDHKSAFMIEINSETDFTARDQSFLAFTEMVGQKGLQARTDDLSKLDGVEEARQQLVHKIGENIQLRRAVFIESSGCVAAYNHGARIGVVVALDKGSETLGRDIAMHVAAMNPQATDESDLDPALIAKEKEIFIDQAKQTGKPDNIIEKMVQGRIAKYVKESCFGESAICT